MSSLMIQDISNLANAFGQFAGSVAQLHQTRVNVEAERRQAQLARMQQNFLAQADLPIGDPNRLTSTNWRDMYSQYQQEVEGYMGNIVDPTIRDAVGNMFQGQISQFQIQFSQSMAKVEREETQFESLELLRLDAANGNTQALMQHLNTFDEIEMFSPQDRARVQAEIVSPYFNNMLAGQALSRVNPEFKGNSFDAAIRSVSTTQEHIVDEATGAVRPVTNADRTAAIAILEQRRTQYNESAEEIIDEYITRNNEGKSVTADEVLSAVGGTVRNLDTNLQVRFGLLYRDLIADVAEGNAEAWYSQALTAYGAGCSRTLADRVKGEFMEWFATSQSVTDEAGKALPESEWSADTIATRRRILEQIDSWGRDASSGASEAEVAADAGWYQLLYIEQDRSNPGGEYGRTNSPYAMRNYLNNVVAESPELAAWADRKQKEIDTLYAGRDDLLGNEAQLIAQATDAQGLLAARGANNRLYNEMVALRDKPLSQWNGNDREIRAASLVYDALQMTYDQLNARGEGNTIADGNVNELFNQNLVALSGLFEFTNRELTDPWGRTILQAGAELYAMNENGQVNLANTSSAKSMMTGIQIAVNTSLVLPLARGDNLRAVDGSSITTADVQEGRLTPVFNPTNGDIFYYGKGTLFAVNSVNGDIVLQRYNNSVGSIDEARRIAADPSSVGNNWGSRMSSTTAPQRTAEYNPAAIAAMAPASIQNTTTALESVVTKVNTLTRNVSQNIYSGSVNPRVLNNVAGAGTTQSQALERSVNDVITSTNTLMTPSQTYLDNISSYMGTGRATADEVMTMQAGSLTAFRTSKQAITSLLTRLNTELTAERNRGQGGARPSIIQAYERMIAETNSRLNNWESSFNSQFESAFGVSVTEYTESQRARR